MVSIANEGVDNFESNVNSNNRGGKAKYAPFRSDFKSHLNISGAGQSHNHMRLDSSMPDIGPSDILPWNN